MPTPPGSRHRVLAVVGTRPNFMKTAPVLAELERRSDRFATTLVHTGQHYDDAMSTVFFDELGVGQPQHLLGIGSGSHATQTARVMERLEPILLATQPDIVLVPGDVNSTLAAALVAVKLGIRIGHIESGLRSFDRTMPEEINRVLCDAIADLLFVHSPEAVDHLLAEGRPADRIHVVGNTMIDTLQRLRPRFDASALQRSLGLVADRYVVVTLHRPALVDGDQLGATVAALRALSRTTTVVFPCHPRTRARIEAAGLAADAASGIHLVDPLGYLEFMGLVQDAAGVVTDSGGIQEETTVLGVPCLTLRENTERPVTISHGTNRLLGLAPERIADVPRLIDEIRAAPRSVPDGWDGHASVRVVDVLERELGPATPPPSG